MSLPLNPRWLSKKLIIPKCRFMGSKKVPLWLHWENADPFAGDIVVMFKGGDDLRQDMLTIQVLQVMDRLWLQHKMDLQLKPYGVIATGVNKHGEGVGMLEMVVPSKPLNSINVGYGGAFNEQTINLFLQQHNKGTTRLVKARERFARSCAGYCVATFVMGIGDRHTDNILLRNNGQLVHIDFGHFLGNFKSKKIMGVSFTRERSAFVFTPDMRCAIDEGNAKRPPPLYEDFLRWVADAYNVLRERSRVLVLLFALMVSADMPELMSEADIRYLVDMLQLNYSQHKAANHVHALLRSSLKDTVRLWDNLVHQKVRT